MTTKINTLQEALTAIAETAYKINGSTVLTSEHCAALTGALYNSRQREDALTKIRDEALRDLAECTAQLRETSKQLNESIAASMTSAQERTELEARIAELEAQLACAGRLEATLRNQLSSWVSQYDTALAEYKRDLAAARKALEPFANEAKFVPVQWPDGIRLQLTSMSCTQFTVGDLRAAARAAQSDGWKVGAK